jgi:hypothetical protein
VTNASNFTGGEAQQDDSNYRETIRNLIQSLTGATSAAIKAKALNVPGIVTATLVEFIQHVKEWSVGGGVTVGDYFAISRPILYIADANGTASSLLIQDVRDAIEGTRACGVFIDVIGATAVTVDWTASVTLNPAGPNYATFLSDTSMIAAEMNKYISDLEIGDDFNRALARVYIMERFGPLGTNDLVDFVTSIPAGEISISETQKAIPGVISV